MPRIVWLPLCAALLAPAVAQAATLRAYRALPGSTVRLSDLFDGMAAPDRVLGAAPAPGARILVQAPQLAAIARDYGVDWRPMTGAEQTILERQSTPYSLESLRALLRPELARAGAPADSTIVLPDFAPPALPVGVAAHAAIADFSYDPASSRFTALLTLTVADSPPVAARLAGEVVQLVDAAVLTHPLHAGAVIEAEDVRAAHLPATDLRLASRPCWALRCGGIFRRARRSRWAI
jgi:flagella basal body P-ring formation protein FlgA